MNKLKEIAHHLARGIVRRSEVTFCFALAASAGATGLDQRIVHVGAGGLIAAIGLGVIAETVHAYTYEATPSLCETTQANCQKMGPKILLAFCLACGGTGAYMTPKTPPVIMASTNAASSQPPAQTSEVTTLTPVGNNLK